MRAPLTPETTFDERLPQLDELLNARQMGVRFARALQLAPTQRLTDCQITRSKYRPGRNCVICYRLSMTDLNTGRAHEQLLSALAMGPGESRTQFINAQQRPLAPTALGASVFHLPELETVVWVFPNDRKLTGLPVLADANRLQNEILPAVVATSCGAEWQIVTLTSGVIHYVAERTCTVCAELELRHTRSDAMMKRTLFGKTYSLDEDAAAWQAMAQLWQSAPCQQGRLLIPQPLAYQPEIKTCWQSGLAGQTLGELKAGGAAREQWMAQAGAAVAALHGASVSGLRTITTAEVVAKLEAATAVIVRAHPSLQPQLPALVSRLIATADRAGAQPRATLHGDLHLQNLFVTEERVALIDLDDLCRGDPLQDLGSFTAALHYRALLGGGNVPATAARIEQFIAAYRRHVAWEVSASALAWHTAVALIAERAYRCITRLKAGRRAILDDLIALAQRLSAH